MNFFNFTEKGFFNYDSEFRGNNKKVSSTIFLIFMKKNHNKQSLKGTRLQSMGSQRVGHN